MVSVCLPADAFLQHLPSYLSFSYLEHGVSLHGCASKAQPLLVTLDEGYPLTATLPELQRAIAPLGPPAPAQPPFLGLLLGLLLLAATPGLRHGVAPLGRSCAVTAWHSWPLPLTLDVGELFLATVPQAWDLPGFCS